jgi:hypothetical protein
MPVRPIDRCQRPWNKGLLIGQKKPLEPKHVWSIRVLSARAGGWGWRGLMIVFGPFRMPHSLAVGDKMPVRNTKQNPKRSCAFC